MFRIYFNSLGEIVRVESEAVRNCGSANELCAEIGAQGYFSAVADEPVYKLLDYALSASHLHNFHQVG